MRKRAYLLKLIYDIRASYWFIPAVLVLLSLLLAHATEWLDRNTDVLPFQLPDAFVNTQIEGARSTLSTIATAVIGVTGVMFSMTILAVSFAAGNYGPRLIGNFMRDRGNQISLGILISTFVYALSILRAVQDPSESGGIEAFVPQYSMLFAMLGSLIAVFTMIYFVHHVPETINVSNITAKVGGELELALKDTINAEEKVDRTQLKDAPDRDPDTVISLDAPGYLQTLRYARVAELAEENDLHCDVVNHAGDFVTATTPVMHVWTDAPLSDDTREALRDCFATGSSRTAHQNVFFLVDELVEVLGRALSPGVNDPFTAINCLNWMHNGLKTAQKYKDGLGEDGSGHHLLGPRLTFAALYDRSFGASKPYCDDDHLVRAHFKDLASDLNRET